MSRTLVRPYMFLLQEGKKIKKDLLDYHLTMLDLRCREVIHKPPASSLPQKHKKPVKSKSRLIPEMEALARQLRLATTPLQGHQGDIPSLPEGNSSE